MKSSFKYLVVGLSVLFLLIIIGSLIFTKLFGPTDDEKQQDIEVKFYGSEIITINNTLPMTDEVGKKIVEDEEKIGIVGYLDFEVKSIVDKNVKYEVYLTKNGEYETIQDKFVKVYLTDQDENELLNFKEARVPTYYDLKLSDTDLSGKTIYYGILNGSETQKFRLRMWVADTYALNSNLKRNSVKVNVRVR